MDVFVFPSRYEGLGMGAVEAQMCGVRTVISEKLPPEAKIADSTSVLKLADRVKTWADEILHIRPSGDVQDMKDPYDIAVQAKKLTDYYGGYCNAKKRFVGEKLQRSNHVSGTQE